MDILTQVVDVYWNWIGGFNPILSMFFIRWGVLLLFTLLLGILVRKYKPPFGPISLACQTGVIIGAIMFCFMIPLSKIYYMNRDLHNYLITISFLIWFLSPYFIPKIVIRRRGFQEMVWPYIYGLEVVLLIIQLIKL